MTEALIQEFAERLWSKIDRSPPEAADDINKAEWVCGNDGDPLFYAKETAREMGLNLSDILTDDSRFCCDCELVFNLWKEDDEDEDDDKETLHPFVIPDMSPTPRSPNHIYTNADGWMLVTDGYNVSLYHPTKGGCIAQVLPSTDEAIIARFAAQYGFDAASMHFVG